LGNVCGEAGGALGLFFCMLSL